MSDDAEKVLFEAHRASVEKHTYFLLASAGAAIGFAVTRTGEAALSWSSLPLGVAIMAWGTSFYFGCRQVAYVQSSLWANSELLRVRRGTHPNAGDDPEVIAGASAGILEAIDGHGKRATSSARWQFRTLIGGGVLYVVWHILQMYLRTSPAGAP